MKYPFRVYQMKVEDHIFWAAECSALKGCVGQGETIEEALAELESNERSWLELAKEYGMDIPPIPVEQTNVHSGKLTLRIAPYVHHDAAENAKKQNISLNQYINDAIVAQNARFSTIGFVAPEVKDAIQLFKDLILPPSESVSRGESASVHFRSGTSSFRGNILNSKGIMQVFAKQ